VAASVHARRLATAHARWGWKLTSFFPSAKAISVPPFGQPRAGACGECAHVGYSGVTAANIAETGAMVSAGFSFVPWTPKK
jgi:hypothetical protein